MSYDPTIAPQYIGGGGYGGWGGGCGYGGFGGIGLFGLLGLRGIDGDRDRRGHDNDCCEKELDLINDNMNSRFNSLENRENAEGIQNQIGGFQTRMDTFKDFTLTEFGNVKMGQALLGKDVVIAEKDLLHNQDKCCCEIQKNEDAHFAALLHQADKDTCAILRAVEIDGDRTRAKIADLKDEWRENEIEELRAFRNRALTIDAIGNQVNSSFNRTIVAGIGNTNSASSNSTGNVNV